MSYLDVGFVWIEVVDPLQGVDVEVSQGHFQTFVFFYVSEFTAIKDQITYRQQRRRLQFGTSTPQLNVMWGHEDTVPRS